MRERRGWRRLVRENAYRDVWLLLTTILVVWAIVLTYDTSNQTHEALCALRGDLQHRVDQGTKFLAEHPDGAFGFTPAEIRTQIDNQQRTISALTALNCKQ